MDVTILSLFPEMFQGPLTTSLIGKAREKGLLNIEIVNFRDYAEGVHKKADDLPYGGGAGMVIMPEPLSKALDDYNAAGKRVIFPTPSGKKETPCPAAARHGIPAMAGLFFFLKHRRISPRPEGPEAGGIRFPARPQRLSRILCASARSACMASAS